MICYACLKRKANSLEHVIPSFLGGKKKVKVLCHLCNNFFGSTIEKNFYTDCEARKFVILKIALNFYFWKFSHHNSSYKNVDEAVEMLRHLKFKKEIIFSIKEENLTKDSILMHQEQKTLYGFINLKIGFFKVILSENFEGKLNEKL